MAKTYDLRRPGGIRARPKVTPTCPACFVEAGGDYGEDEQLCPAHAAVPRLVEVLRRAADTLSEVQAVVSAHDEMDEQDGEIYQECKAAEQQARALLAEIEEEA